MTSNEALKPCPRCGNSAFITGTDSYAVWCRTDNCLQMPPRASRDAAIEAWNTRSTDTPVCASTEGLLSDEDGLRELGRLYNCSISDDTPQFTRWQMIVAMNHGIRLAASQAPERLREALEEAREKIAQWAHVPEWQATLAKIDAALSSIPEPLIMPLEGE